MLRATTLVFLNREMPVMLAATQILGDTHPELALDLIDRAARVDRGKAKFRREAPIFLDQTALVSLKRIEQVGTQGEVHTRFPVIHAFALHHAWNQRLHIDI